MEQVKKIIKTILFETYVNEGKVLTFQEVQNILISKGFSYYQDENGVKKLRILRKIRPYYNTLKGQLPKMKNNRDFVMETLEDSINKYLQGEISYKVVNNTFQSLKEFLTRNDIQLIKNMKKKPKEKSFKVRF